MIKINNLSKSFEGFQALDHLNVNIKKGSIYGLVGVNGSGKTTLIKHLTGVYQPDSGEILVDDMPSFDNMKVKNQIGYIPDDLFFFSSYHLKDSAKFYKSLYSTWSQERYETMLKQFGLSETQRLSKFSKGMQKQAAFILTMSTMPNVLILDEPIDGLDPIVRKLVLKCIVEDVAEREMTVLVSSHNLKEMEGICDSIGILSKGKMVIERDLDELKSDIHKVQVVFSSEENEHTQEKASALYKKLQVLYLEKRGSVDLLIVKGKREEVVQTIKSGSPVVFDILPLSLEEIFIYELGGDNNELKDILF